MASDALSKEILKQAIVAEIDGQKFYKFLADRAQNPDAKRKLGNLAKDEVRHEALLMQVYKDIHGEEVKNLPKKGTGVLAEFFARSREKDNLSEMQYIDMAIEAELAATGYYKEAARAASGKDVQKICQMMADEEFRHYESLKAEKEALTGNYFWFGYDEGTPMET